MNLYPYYGKLVSLALMRRYSTDTGGGGGGGVHSGVVGPWDFPYPSSLLPGLGHSTLYTVIKILYETPHVHIPSSINYTPFKAFTI